MPNQLLPIDCNNCVVDCNYPFQVPDAFTLNLSLQVGPIPQPMLVYGGSCIGPGYNIPLPFTSWGGSVNYVPAYDPTGTYTSCIGCPLPPCGGTSPTIYPNSKYQCVGGFFCSPVLGPCLEWTYQAQANYAKYYPGIAGPGAQINLTLQMQRVGVPQSYFQNSGGYIGAPLSLWIPQQPSDYYGGSVNDFNWAGLFNLIASCADICRVCGGSPFQQPGLAYDKQGYLAIDNPCAGVMPLPAITPGLGLLALGCPDFPCECVGPPGSQQCICAPAPTPPFDPANPSNSATGFIELGARFGIAISVLQTKYAGACYLWLFAYILDVTTIVKPIYYYNVLPVGDSWCPPAPTPLPSMIGISFASGDVAGALAPGCCQAGGYTLTRGGGFQWGNPNCLTPPGNPCPGPSTIGWGFVPVCTGDFYAEGGVIDANPNLLPAQPVCGPGPYQESPPDEFGPVFPEGGAHCCCEQMAECYTLSVKGGPISIQETSLSDGSYTLCWIGGGNNYCCSFCNNGQSFEFALVIPVVSSGAWAGLGDIFNEANSYVTQTLHSCNPLVLTGVSQDNNTVISLS